MKSTTLARSLAATPYTSLKHGIEADAMLLLERSEAASKLHRELLCSVRHKLKSDEGRRSGSELLRHVVVGLLNDSIGSTLKRLTELHSDLSTSHAEYVFKIPGPPDDEYVCDYQGLFIGCNPNIGLPELTRFRKLPVLDQWWCLDALTLASEVQSLERQIASERPRSLNDAEELGKLREEFERASLGVSATSLELAKSANFWLTRDMCVAVVPVLGTTMSIETMAFASQALDEAASAAFGMAWDTLAGAGAMNTRRAWMEVRVCAERLRLLSAWVRGLTALHSELPCELCYRHRGTGKRCRCHRSSGKVTREVRFAQKVAPGFRARVRAHAGAVSSFRFRPPSPTNTHFHREIDSAIELLEEQLLQLEPIVGETLWSMVLDLCGRMIVVTREVSARPPTNTDEMQMQREAVSFCSLRGFWQLWCGKEARHLWRDYGVEGHEFDPDNRFARAGVVGSDDLLGTLIRQRAWTEACEEFERTTTITRERIEAVAEELNTKSSRKIADVLKCSHTYVSNILRGYRPETRKADTRLRANFKTFNV